LEGITSFKVVEIDNTTKYEKTKNLYSDKIAVYENDKKLQKSIIFLRLKEKK
jgi:hypothetical protein